LNIFRGIMNWEEKLNKFLDEFEHIDDVIGVLA
jgi:hypothetical protein